MTGYVDKQRIERSRTIEELEEILAELQEMVDLAEVRKDNLQNDSKVVVLFCGHNSISVVERSKFQYDNFKSMSAYGNGDYKVLEIARFGRPNTKKYNEYKEKMKEKYANNLYAVKE